MDRDVNNTKNNVNLSSNIGFLNVCGLRRRSLFPEFSELVSKYDLFFVAETKMDSTDLVNINGYDFLSKPRQQAYISRSGGLGLFVKHDLSRYIKTLHSDSDYVLWVQLDKGYMQSEQHIIFGIVYLPPTQSRFLNEDDLECLQIEITDMCSKFDLVYLAGDFSAQTADLADFTIADDFLDRHFDLDDDLTSFYNQKAILERLGIQVHRKSMDTKRNNHGYKLIEICKNNNLFILNGRFGKDQNICSYTFKKSSVIDYIISTAPSLELLLDFEITPLDRLYSDGHALLSFKIKGRTCITQSKTHKQNMGYPTWDATKVHSFQNNISLQRLQDVADQLSREAKNNDITQCSIDKIVSDISDIFIESASNSFESRPKFPTREQRKKQNKPWFGPACHHTRKAYNAARSKYNHNPTPGNYLKLQKACKTYKNTMNTYINRHNKNNEEKLRNMHCKRPKDYWKILNSIKNKTAKEMPDINSFYDHFQECNLPDDDSEDMPDESANILRDNNEYLNSPITTAEIEKCISLLKNSKSPGKDNILNEYIKTLNIF